MCDDILTRIRNEIQVYLFFEEHYEDLKCQLEHDVGNYFQADDIQFKKDLNNHQIPTSPKNTNDKSKPKKQVIHDINKLEKTRIDDINDGVSEHPDSQTKEITDLSSSNNIVAVIPITNQEENNHTQNINVRNKTNSGKKDNIETQKNNKKNIKQKLRYYYRKIMLSSHPDKIGKQDLISVMWHAQKNYQQKYLSVLIFLADYLHIDLLPINNQEEINQLRQELDSIEDTIQKLSHSLPCLWYLGNKKEVIEHLMKKYGFKKKKI